MKRKVLGIVGGVGILALLSLYNSCGSTVNFERFTSVKGTTIGNPMAPVSSKIMDAICGVVNRCNPQVSISMCQNEVLGTPGFGIPLGAPTNYDTLSSIVAGEQSGNLVENISNTNSCYTGINALACSAPTVVAAYNSTLTNPFSQTPGMIPTGSSCNQVYAPSVPTFVQLQEASVTNNSKLVSTPNFANTVASGDFLACVVFYNNATQTVSSITDSGGNGYNRANGPTRTSGSFSGWTLETWIVVNPSQVSGGSNFSVTANFTGAFSGEKDISCHEYSGVAPLNAEDFVSSDSGAGANASTALFPVNSSNELIFGAAIFASPGATSGPGFIQRSSLKNIVTEDKVINTPGSYGITFSNGATNWNTHLLTVKGN